MKVSIRGPSRADIQGIINDVLAAMERETAEEERAKRPKKSRPQRPPKAEND